MLDYATGHQHQPPFFGVRADHDVDTCPGSGNNAINRTCGKDLPIDHRLEGQQVGRHLPPALRVGVCVNVGLQLLLNRKQAVEGNRRDRLSGCCDAKLLGKVLADPLHGRGAGHMMS